MLYKILVLFLLIIIVYGTSKFKKLYLEKDILIAFLRASVQVFALSIIILKIFQLSHVWTFIALCFMGVAGVLTARTHGKFLKNSFWITFYSLFLSSFLIIFLMIILNIIDNKAKIVLPLGGMVIGNCMNSISLAYDRLYSEIKSKKLLIETMLSLGFPSQVIYNKIKKPCIKAAMIPKINNMKSLGLVWIPGLMAGMILSGADPIEAAIYQLIIITMIVVSSFLSTLVVVEVLKRQIFNKYEQLIFNG